MIDLALLVIPLIIGITTYFFRESYKDKSKKGKVYDLDEESIIQRKIKRCNNIIGFCFIVLGLLIFVKFIIWIKTMDLF